MSTQSPEPTKQEMDEAIRQVYMMAAQMMREGRSRHVIIDQLVQAGLSRPQAESVVGNLESARRDAKRKGGQQAMLWGAIICIVGIVITVGTYSAARSGGSYVVAWGAIVFGGLRFLQGLIASIS